MTLILNTPDEVIDALGGTKAAAEKLRQSMQTVSNWRRGRIPPEHFLSVTTALGQQQISPDVFGMKRPAVV